MKVINVAIDGPAGAGKSTISRKAAAELGFIYIDTGALYRTVGYYVYSNGIDPQCEDAIAKVLPEINIELKYEGETQRVILNGEDLGDKIRMPEMSMYASAVSSKPVVRAFLLEMQKSLARAHSVVMDGRDIDLKIFLTASNETRAMRRTLELQEKGVDAKYEDVLADMIERDKNDKNRNIAPAVPADDAIIFDNSVMNVEDSVKEIVRLLNERK